MVSEATWVGVDNYWRQHLTWTHINYTGDVYVYPHWRSGAILSHDKALAKLAGMSVKRPCTREVLPLHLSPAHCSLVGSPLWDGSPVVGPSADVSARSRTHWWPDAADRPAAIFWRWIIYRRWIICACALCLPLFRVPAVTDGIDTLKVDRSGNGAGPWSVRSDSGQMMWPHNGRHHQVVITPSQRMSSH